MGVDGNTGTGNPTVILILTEGRGMGGEWVGFIC